MKTTMKKALGVGILSLIALSAVSLFAVCTDKSADGSCMTECSGTNYTPETQGDSGDNEN